MFTAIQIEKRSGLQRMMLSFQKKRSLALLRIEEHAAAQRLVGERERLTDLHAASAKNRGNPVRAVVPLFIKDARKIGGWYVF